MSGKAIGTFQIKMSPPPSGEGAGHAAIGRMMLDKQYSGDLAGIGVGEMLSAGNPALGSASYVAIEHITGTLGGRAGSFALQHAGTMHKGEHDLVIRVVPGSGTGELEGITGMLKLDIVDRVHHYVLDYQLP